MARSRSAIGRTNQRKGKDFQHRVALALATATGLSERDFNSNHGGVLGEEDIYISSAAREKWPFYTETKNAKNLSLPAWIRKQDQDIKDTGEEIAGVVLYKLFRTSRVRVDLDFLVLLDLLYGPLSSSTKRRLQECLSGKIKRGTRSGSTRSNKTSHSSSSHTKPSNKPKKWRFKV